MSRVAFIGDVMLGRIIGEKYRQNPYQVVSEDIKAKIKDSDFVIANLESPVVVNANTEGDHLQFKGNPDVLNQLSWINAFSLSNNHINDAGILGMNETVEILEEKGFRHSGIFNDEYTPIIIEQDDTKIAVVTITDMMNIPFSENCEWDVLRVGEPRVYDIIKKYHDAGYFIILYAHIGILFCRYPNPISFNYLHSCIDAGADAIVTAHSHCLGCMEVYKNKYIFHSLGDFIMDGNSFRRRQSAILKLDIKGQKVENWELIPAEVNMNYETVQPSEKVSKRMLTNFGSVSSKLEKHTKSYDHFFKYQYKKELFNHICSTFAFLYKQRGLLGMLRMICIRFEEVGRMFTWISKDRSKDQRDDDAIKANRKKFSNKELFNIK